MSQYKKAILGLMFANMIWGAGAPIFKWAFEATIHPFTLAALRFFIPVLFLGIFFSKKLSIKTKDIPLLLVAGLCAITVNIGFFFLGIDKTLSINAPIIGSSGPIFLILGSMIFLGERPSKRTFLGNMLGLTGILLIIIQPLLHVTHGGSFVGNILLILSMFGSVSGAIFSKELLKKYNPLAITFWTFFIGEVSILPFTLQEIHIDGFFSQLSIPAVFAILFGGIFSSLIAYFIYFWGLKMLPASQTSVFAYVDPITGILLAMPLVHEYPNTFFLFGALLVFLGIFIAEGRIHYHPLHKLLQ